MTRQECYEKVKELRKQGYGVVEIAKKLGISQSTVRILLGME